MKNGRIIYLLVCLFFYLSLSAQNTIGLLSYDIGQTYEGLTLIYPSNQPNVYLINNCGEIVHTWTDDSSFRPGNTAYITDEGNLIKTKRNASIAGDAIWAGGGGAIVEIRSWDNDLLWSFELNNEVARLHHDIAPMPNGNILMLAWERISGEDAIAAGRNPDLLAQGEMWPDYVFEINPATDEIVWEWHIWDHLVQDFDETKDNFGVVADNNRLVDVNYDNNENRADWNHCNAIDYNAELDQILLSSPFFDEIWIIDHSTTTEEAAGHIGGLSFRGGDLMSRLGNQRVYKQGDESDQFLFFQHDAHWTNRFIEENNPYYGDIVVFNNQAGPDFSRIDIFDPGFVMYIWGYEEFNGVFLPEAPETTITHPVPQELFSTGLSSAQLLPNGNVLACSGRFGYLVELSPSNEVVWEYVTPIVGGIPAEQGTELGVNDNLTFRAFKYPSDFVAFEGRDLSPKGFIESNPNEAFCDQITSTHNFDVYGLNIFPNPAEDRIQITWDNGGLIDIEIYDLLGNRLIQTRGNGGMHYVDVSELSSNIYFIRIDKQATGKLIIR